MTNIAEIIARWDAGEGKPYKGKTHWSYDEARSCESGHVLDAAIDRTRDAIEDAFRGQRKKPVAKGHPHA